MIGDYAPNSTGDVSVGLKSSSIMNGTYVSYKPTTDSEMSIEFYTLGLSSNYRYTFLRKKNFSFSTGAGGTLAFETEGAERYGFFIIESPFAVTWFNNLTLLWLTIKPGLVHLNSNFEVCEYTGEKENCSTIGPNTSFMTTFGIGAGYTPPKGLRMLVSFNMPYIFSNINNLTTYSIGFELGYDLAW